jgi:hypothetical protein
VQGKARCGESPRKALYAGLQTVHYARLRWNPSDILDAERQSSTGRAACSSVGPQSPTARQYTPTSGAVVLTKQYELSLAAGALPRSSPSQSAGRSDHAYASRRTNSDDIEGTNKLLQWQRRAASLLGRSLCNHVHDSASQNIEMTRGRLRGRGRRQVSSLRACNRAPVPRVHDVVERRALQPVKSRKGTSQNPDQPASKSSDNQALLTALAHATTRSARAVKPSAFPAVLARPR